MIRLTARLCLVPVLILSLLTACQQSPSVLENSLSNAALAGDNPYEVAVDGPITTPAWGAPLPLVVITTFEDFQCPFCRFVGPAAQRVVNAYPKDVQVHFRHRPLSFHPLAIVLARATTAAHRQGKFKLFKDLLFSRQHIFTRTKADPKKGASDNYEYRMRLVNLAAELGLDAKRFALDLGIPAKGQRPSPSLGSKAVTDKIAQDNAKGILLGARGTPSIYVNGKKIRLAGAAQGNFESLMKAVRAERDIGNRMVERGVPRHQIVAQRIAANQPSVKDATAWLLDNADVPSAKLANATKNDKPRGSVPQDVFRVPLPKGAPVKGAKTDALVTIVEFSDFECGYCSRVHPTLEALVKEFPKDLRVAYLNLPLRFHKNARPAAKAALCAHEQDKFWPYHDLLFSNMRALGEAGTFDRLAVQVGLDTGKFTTCRASGRVDKAIDRDVQLAGSLSVRGTPHLFINGRRARGALPLDQLRGIVEEEIAKARKLAAKHGRGDALYTKIIASGKKAPGLLTDETVTLNLDDSPRLGPATAAVKVAVFSDFQCPYCSKIKDPLHDLQKALPNDVAVYFKHFPLGFHKKAVPAALASICAHKQSKFWPFHDKIFGSDLSDQTLDTAARFVGLDMAAFTKCKTDPAVRKTLDNDMAEARTANVSGTPSIYINGRKYNIAFGTSVSSLTKAVRLAQKGK